MKETAISIEDVERIVSKYYEPHDSKYIFGGRKRAERYFYNTNKLNWYMDFAASLDTDLFDTTGAPNNIELNFSKKSEEWARTTEREMLLILKEKKTQAGYMNYITLAFYPLIGLTLKKVYNKMGLALKTANRPVTNLHIREDGELYWSNNDNRFCYLKITPYLNKFLYANENFRNIIVDILMLIGESRKILKDVARTIQNDHFFLKPIKMHDVCKYRTPDELVKSESQHTLPINFNKKNLNYSWCVTHLSEVIEPDDFGLLLNIPDDDLIEWLGGGIHLLDGDAIQTSRICDFIANYYVRRLVYRGILPVDMRDRVYIFARDYAHLCINMGEPISLRKQGLRALEEAHNIARIQAITHAEHSDDADFSSPLPPENSKFQELRNILPKEFIHLDSAKALFEEGERQHNCVFSYSTRVRRDESAIYHWEIEGREYTIEFGKVNNQYTIRQMLKKHNRPADPTDQARVLKHVLPALTHDDMAIGN